MRTHQTDEPTSKQAFSPERRGVAFAMETPAPQLAPRNTGSAARSVLQMQRVHGNRYVQRTLALARKENDGAEVSSDVETAIEQARTGGQSLDHGTRTQMESAFGADFSGVRIHTGAESHALNRAVNAVAFTTGSDIFFRDGAYAPGNSSGQELLAHELTHVVQQGAAVQARGIAQPVPVQRMCTECEKEKEDQFQAKLVVGGPDDQYEQEAEQVSKAVMATLSPSSTEFGLVRHAASMQRQAAGEPALFGKLVGGNSPSQEKQFDFGKADQAHPASTNTDMIGSMGQPALQRAVVRDLRRGGTHGFISLDATGELFEGSTRLETVSFPNGLQEASFNTIMQQNTNQTRHGTLRLNLVATWDFSGGLGALPGAFVGGRAGRALIAVDTPFRVPKTSSADDDTLVRPGQPHVSRQESSGGGASLDASPQVTADTDDIGLAVTASPRVTYQEQAAVQVGGNVNVPIIGPLTPQVQGQTTNTQAFGASFTAHLQVPKSQITYNCQQAFGPFVIGSDRFMNEDDARQRIHDWYFGLEPHVRQDLEQGKGLLRATGRASTTGSKTFNLSLAENRAKKVRDIIAEFGGSDAHFRSFAVGEFGAQTPDNREDPNERRVDVQVSGTAAGLMAPGSSDPCSGFLGQTTPTTGPTGPVTPSQSGTGDVTPATGTSGGSGGASTAFTTPAPGTPGATASNSFAPAAVAQVPPEQETETTGTEFVDTGANQRVAENLEEEQS